MHTRTVLAILCTLPYSTMYPHPHITQSSGHIPNPITGIEATNHPPNHNNPILTVLKYKQKPYPHRNKTDSPLPPPSKNTPFTPPRITIPPPQSPPKPKTPVLSVVSVLTEGQACGFQPWALGAGEGGGAECGEDAEVCRILWLLCACVCVCVQ